MSPLPPAAWRFRPSRTLLLFLLLALPVHLSAHTWSDTALIVGNGTGGPYFLTGRPLLADSVRLYRTDGAPHPPLDYLLESNPGRLVFAEAMLPGDTVIVVFSALPFSLPSISGVWLTQETASHEARGQPQGSRRPAAAESTPEPFRLNLTGAKTFGITVDSRSRTRTEQGLQLGLEGRLTETVTLSAAVSDRFSDRLSSGASASRLDRLDQFLVALRGPSVTARLGRLEYRPRSPDAGPPRSLSGIEFGLERAENTVAVAGGKLTGTAHRAEFSPQYGRQGPYPLTARRQPIVTQSERVYLDGRSLERGAERDYTIDYFAGEITFNPRVTLTELNRVTVTFEESATTYDRRAVFGNWRTVAQESRFANEIGVQWEGDDPGGGVGFALSIADRDTLRQDNRGEILRDGAVYVGPGRGEYRARDSLGQSVYEYVGPDNGDHHVRFAYVGAGQGTYVHLGNGAYGFAGSGNGDFLPQVTITAPNAHLLMTNRLRLTGSPLGSIDASAVGLAYEPNRLHGDSRITDWSHDLSWSTGSDTTGAPDNSALNLGARWRRLGQSDRVSAGMAGRDVARTWFLPPAFAPRNLHVIESRATVAPRSLGALCVSSEYGALTGEATGTRNAQSLAARFARRLSVEVNHQQSSAALHHLARQRTREVWAVSQHWEVMPAQVFSGARRESRTDEFSLAERFDTYEVGIGVSGMRTGVSLDRVHQGTGRPTLVEKRRRLWLDASVSARELGLSGTIFGSRISRVRLSDGHLSRDYLGQADMQWRVPAGGLSATAHYSLNQIGAQARIASFIPVAPGFGNYRREDGLVVGDPRGDLVRAYGATGELHPAAVGRKELSLRREYANHRGSLLRQFNDLSAEVRLVREDAIDPDRISVTPWMVPWGALSMGRKADEYLWTHRENSVSVERRLATASAPWFIRGRYDTKHDQFSGSAGGHDRSTVEFSGRGTRPRRAWTTWEVAVARHERRLSGYAGVADAEVLTHLLQTTSGWTLAEQVSVSTQVSAEHVRGQRNTVRAVIYGLAPSVTVRFGRGGKGSSLRTSLDYDYAHSRLSNEWILSGASVYVAGNNLRWLFDCGVQLTRNISLRSHSTLDWFGKQRPAYRFDVQAVSSF